MYENFGNFLLIIFTISKIDFTIKKPILGRKRESMTSETTRESMTSETPGIRLTHTFFQYNNIIFSKDRSVSHKLSF